MCALRCLPSRLSTMPKIINKPHLVILLPLLAASLSSCALIEPRDSDSKTTRIEHWLYGASEQREEAVALLNRFKVLDSLPANKLKAAHKSAERLFSKQPTLAARLQLAWLLAMKNTGFQDIPRAAKLLNTKRKSNKQEQQPEVLDDLVYLIRRMVEEQRLQRDNYRRVVTALNAEREISRELATKIKDLTLIEESMIQRKSHPETELR